MSVRADAGAPAGIRLHKPNPCSFERLFDAQYGGNVAGHRSLPPLKTLDGRKPYFRGLRQLILPPIEQRPGGANLGSFQHLGGNVPDSIALDKPSITSGNPS
jgi:hypothetical protein